MILKGGNQMKDEKCCHPKWKMGLFLLVIAAILYAKDAGMLPMLSGIGIWTIVFALFGLKFLLVGMMK